MNKNLSRSILAGFTATLLALTAACGSSQTASQPSETVTEGKLTIATGEPAYSPWVEDNKPESQKGFESAVAYAVAKELGYKPEDVKWVRTTFDSAIAPGAKDWDMNIQQFSITPERRKAVDFSSSYYNTTQAVLVKADGKYANAKSLADLKDARIGSTVGTTSLESAKKIKEDIQTYNSNEDGVQALANNAIDGFVIDTPSAVYTAEDGQAVKNAKVVGQIYDSADKEGMGIVLPKGSKLTDKVTKAVNTLNANGTLKKLAEKWLSSYTNLPVLR